MLAHRRPKHLRTAHCKQFTCNTKIAEPDADDYEEQQMLRFTLQQTRDALMTGEFKVLPWAAVMAAKCPASINVAFRSEKVAGFRGAKDDDVTLCKRTPLSWSERRQ